MQQICIEIIQHVGKWIFRKMAKSTLAFYKRCRMDLLKMFQNEYFVTKIEIYRKECTLSNVRIQAQLQSIYKTFATT